MTKRMYSGLLAFLFSSGLILAGPVETPAGSWEALRAEILKLGLSIERVDHTIAACRENGLSVGNAEDLFCPVYTAHEAGLPTGCLFIKIEEGVAKGIAWQEVHAAADRRLECLRVADSLVMTVRGIRGEQHRHLVMHICMALESGLPEEVIAAVLQRPARFRYGRMIHVIEAGESLQLAGLEPAQTLKVMNDCVDRDLNCSEAMRVVDFFQRGLLEGKDFDSLYSSLWVSPGVIPSKS